ncbi:MAG: inositol monophosphatase, partial [Myxococcales bacterium]|nr:inositol monophosphatase [Myxococcales bacterium]
LGTAWRGVPGAGAERNGEPCRVSTTHELADALVATGFHPAARQDPAQDNRDTFARVLTCVRDVRRCGSAALDLALTADGTYDAYWERTLNAWDTVAGTAIALAAGATVTNLEGGPVDLSIGHLIASNGHLHREVQALMAAPHP